MRTPYVKHEARGVVRAGQHGSGKRDPVPAGLRRVAKRRGWDVVEVYRDAGISGAKGRNGRPGLDSMLKDASRRKFDIVMAWAIDRLGRSLSDLLDTIGPAGHRHDDTHGQARVSANRRVR